MGMLSVLKAAPRALIKAGNKSLFALKKTKPQILVGGGIVIATGAFVIAIVNARKLDATMAVNEAKMDEIQGRKDILVKNEEGKSEEEVKTSLKEIDKELNKARAEAAWDIFKLIGVPSIMFAGGMAMTFGGHMILVKRFGQVSSLLAATQESFNRYRQMNIAEHGKECDDRYIYGIEDKAETTAKITDENGNEQEVKCEVPVVKKGARTGLYTFEFSEFTSRKCPRDPVNTISFLKSQEKYWNVWMSATGKPVTLAMVLNDLGIELDPDDPANDYILIAGWRPNGDGDCRIDFGIMRAINKPAIDMEVNTVMLNFNCDGNIYHSVRYTKDGKKVSA